MVERRNGTGGRAARVALGCALALSSGCGAIVSRMISNHPDARDPGYFQGVKLDAEVAGFGRAADPVFVLLAPVILFVDMPLSLVVDLVCLPFDVIAGQPDRSVPVPTPREAPKRTPPPAPAPSTQPPPAPPAVPVQEELSREVLPATLQPLWDLVRGRERMGDAGDAVAAGADLAPLVSASGGLRLVEVAGLRARALSGSPPPAVVSAALDARSGGAWVGFRGGLLEVLPGGGEPRSLARGERIQAVARDEGGRTLVGRDGGAWLVDTATGDCRRLVGIERPVAAAFGPTRVAAGSVNGEVVVWELGGWDATPGGAQPRRRVLRGGAHAWVTGLCFDGDAVLWVAYADGGVNRWRVPAEADRAAMVDSSAWEPAAVLALTLGAEGIVASGGGSEHIAFRGPRSSGSLRLEGLGAPTAHVLALDLSADGRELLVGSLDGVVRHVDLATGRVLHRIDLTALEDRPRAVALRPEGRVSVVTERGTLLRFAPE